MSALPSQDSDFTNDENHCSDETKLLLQVSLLVFGAPVLKTVTKFQNQLFKTNYTKKVLIVKKSNLQQFYSQDNNTVFYKPLQACKKIMYTTCKKMAVYSLGLTQVGAATRQKDMSQAQMQQQVGQRGVVQKTLQH